MIFILFILLNYFVLMLKFLKYSIFYNFIFILILIICEKYKFNSIIVNYSYQSKITKCLVFGRKVNGDMQFPF